MSEAVPKNLAINEAETVAGPELPEHLLAKLRINIPGYELLEKIDSGGQATVYRARELTSGLTVAIKVLNGGANADADSRQRLQRETAALKALNHPNIVCVIESGRTPIGLDYLVMNYIAGRPLDAIWKDRKFSAAVAPEPPARLRLFKRICDIVQAAHLKGITHRDLSPSNILITSAGEPHVLDFGLASTAFNDLISPDGKSISVTGQFIGKIKYAAPEQARAGRDPVDIRTDVYALGVILYQILTNGAFPYEVVGNLVDVLNHIINTQPLPPSAVLAARQNAAAGQAKRKNPPLVNETIEAVVLKALEKNPADRYQSAGELATDIDLYLAGRPTTAILRRRQRPARGKRSRMIRVSALILTLSLILGVLMNFRVIMNWLGLTSLAVTLGAGPATEPATNFNGVELTSRQQSLLMQLADAEANIQAINRSLRVAGYKVGQAYDQIDSNHSAMDYRNAIGGGPVRWDAFYGKTAKEYASNGWGDHRPQQFAFIDKSNKDRITRANDQIASIGKDREALLERRKKHEADQARLWATIAFEQIKDRQISYNDLSRLKLVSAAKPADKRPELLRPFVLFLRTADKAADAGVELVEAKPEATFAGISAYLQSGYKTLLDSLAANTSNLNDDDKKQVESLKALCKQLAEECKVVAENHVNALDRDKAREDNSKLTFRFALQESLSKFASEFAELDAQISAASQAWNVAGQAGTETADKLPSASQGNILATAANNLGAGAKGGTGGLEFLPVGSTWTKQAIDPRTGGTQTVTWTVTLVQGNRITVKTQHARGYGFLVIDVDGNNLKVVRHDPGKDLGAAHQPSITNIDVKGTVTRDTISMRGTWKVEGIKGRTEVFQELQRDGTAKE